MSQGPFGDDAFGRRAEKLARFFGTTKVRIFSFWRVDHPEKAYPLVRDRLAKAASLAAKSGIVLVVENEHECNIGTGKELGRVLRDVNSPSLRGNWDPGNAAMLHEAFQPFELVAAEIPQQNGPDEPPAGQDWVDTPLFACLKSIV